METTERKIQPDSYRMLTMLFIILKLGIHFLTNTRYELLRDEMLFFNMGEYLSAGYATVPPVTGLLALLANKLFGFSVFGIRFFPALMGAASVYFISDIVKDLGGGKPALVISCSSYILAPGFLLVGTLFTPNALEELIWLLAAWSIFRMVKRDDPKYWLLTGVLLGIGFLNKYSVIFFVAGYFFALLLSNHRRLLLSRYFLLAVITGLVIISPNIIWQFQHGWPVCIHMAELRNSQLDLMDYSEFPVSLLAFSQGALLISLAGLFILLFLKDERKYQYQGIAVLVILLLFFVMKGKGYYALGALPVLLAFGGYAMEKYLGGRLLPVRCSLYSVSLVMSLISAPSGLPLLSFENYAKYISATRRIIIHPLLVWDNGTKHDFSQAYADMTGWKELAGYVAAAYNSLSETEKRNCTIFGERNYGYAGAVYFYGKELDLPDAVTFHESYVFWAPDSIPEGPLIYIYRDINGMDKLFSDVREIGSVDNNYFREKGLKVFLCRGPLKNIPVIYSEMAAKEKGRFRRV